MIIGSTEVVEYIGKDVLVFIERYPIKEIFA